MCAQGGSTSLIWAATNGHTDCARLLLNAGADKNAKSNVRVESFCCVCSLTCMLFESHFVIWWMLWYFVLLCMHAPFVMLEWYGRVMYLRRHIGTYSRAGRKLSADLGRLQWPRGLRAAAARCRGRDEYQGHGACLVFRVHSRVHGFVQRWLEMLVGGIFLFFTRTFLNVSL